MFGKKKHVEYKIISDSEFKDNHELELIQVIEEDVIVKIPNKNGTTQSVVMRKPRFLVAVKRDSLVASLKKQLKIGVKNYEHYDFMVAENKDLHKSVHAHSEITALLKKDKNDIKGRMEYLKIHLGSDTFTELMANFDRSRKANDQKKSVAQTNPTARG